jgi:ATP-dependent protease HslVU (ClpYQ) peptidase subunit
MMVKMKKLTILSQNKDGSNLVSNDSLVAIVDTVVKLIDTEVVT